MVTQLPSTDHPQDGLRPEGEFPQVVDAEPRRTDVPRILTPSNPVAHWLRLPDRDLAIVDTVNKFNQVSSSQLLRLFFSDNSPASREIRLSRTMARLVKKGAVKRIRVGGYIYIPATSTARNAWPHTLEITNCYTELVGITQKPDSDISLLDFIPEAHRNVGRITLKPDVYVRLQYGDRYRQLLVEVDLGTEHKDRINRKLAAYESAYASLDIKDVRTFPLVVWIVYSDRRRRELQNWVGKSRLFKVMTMTELLEYLGA